MRRVQRGNIAKPVGLTREIVDIVSGPVVESRLGLIEGRILKEAFFHVLWLCRMVWLWFPASASGLVIRSTRPPAIAVAAAPVTPAGRFLFQMPVVGRLDVGNVQEAVAANAEIDERSLDAWLNVDYAAFVNVADITLVTGAFHVQLFQNTVLDDGDAAFFGLQDID